MNRTLHDQPGVGQIFVARQPILDRNRRVFGYALLCRPTQAALGSSESPSGRVIADGLHAIGLDTLTAGRWAFVQVDRHTLLEGVPAALPPGKVVIELPADSEADSEVVAACEELRRAGYAIAIDDFILNERTARLVPLATYLKIDAGTGTAPDTRARIVASLAPSGASLVAKNIETLDRFEDASRDGFMYFQGFFFGGPPLAKPHGAAAANQLANLRLLRDLQNPEISVRQLEELVKHDTALCDRILRTVNSAAFAPRTTVSSILEALVLHGRDPVRRWASFWLIAGLAESAHSELVVMSAVRARCCEILAGTIGGDDAASEGFLVGMCSLLDVILARSMSEVLIELPLDAETQAALRGQDNWKRRVLDCVIAYERGEWDRAIDLAHRTAVEWALLPVAYADALKWSRELQES